MSDEGQNFKPQQGPAVILAGSCSVATRQQIAAYKDGPKIQLDIDQLMSDKLTVQSVISLLPTDGTTALIYSSATPEEIKNLQSKYKGNVVAEKIEQLFATIAKLLVSDGYKKIVVAGGETSGAVVSALNIDAFDIGTEIDPGVPALSTHNDQPIAMALKSGNFGAEDFFAKALRYLEGKP